MKNIKIVILNLSLFYALFFFTSLVALSNDAEREGVIYLKEGGAIEFKAIHPFGMVGYGQEPSNKITCGYEKHNIEIDIYDPNITGIEFLDCSGPSGTATIATLSILKKDGKKFIVEKAWLYGRIEYDFWDIVNDKISRDKIDPRDILRIVFNN